jgi:hypothetical protein
LPAEPKNKKYEQEYNTLVREYAAHRSWTGGTTSRTGSQSARIFIEMSRSISIVFLKAFLTFELGKNLTTTGIFVILNNSGSRITLLLSSFSVVFRPFSYCYNSHVCHMISLDYIEKARSEPIRLLRARPYTVCSTLRILHRNFLYRTTDISNLLLIS